MKNEIDEAARPRVVPPLHPEMVPAALWNRAYRSAAAGDGLSVPLVVGLERTDG